MDEIQPKKGKNIALKASISSRKFVHHPIAFKEEGTTFKEEESIEKV